MPCIIGSDLQVSVKDLSLIELDGGYLSYARLDHVRSVAVLPVPILLLKHTDLPEIFKHQGKDCFGRRSGYDWALIPDTL